MLTIIISILMSLGIINTPSDYDSSNPQQQASYNEWILDEGIDVVD